MTDFWRVSEEKIREAYQNGEFDDLPGFGKPLELEDLSSVPEELRLAYRLLKNANFTISAEEDKLKQEMLTIEKLIQACGDETERARLQKKLTEKLLRYNQFLSKRRIKTNSSVFKNYAEKLEKRFL
ncbi:MAG: DUF1992 domain-containing protein [Caldibacillus debilis]|jgi:hypothetical protein|uniref:DnaJ homologue subfamily C member 28 conserved domain-containing protein n=2 Tax=Caldibacillus debilis TaxID=301148 RepID=A0A420VJV4_9BACI|nr:DnaJ family domain-containing protein [Caldibacillus debilis]MBO2481754.1 DUF1992 domain-containing protein [Bacillaceae bacterium]KYD07599.1 hypothetical protein B4135_4280 [Caldibacillus debilis]MBY6271380.1 DUF1992 domain-containing protein [Bacillaceae bacterium]OUM83527.1 MAG: hypothetical protein BAA03_09425 [Caldibacillus debilis]REJ18111.1 MAG: DUF1992 domain-containing protein [Caldibacillus debilis]